MTKGLCIGQKSDKKIGASSILPKTNGKTHCLRWVKSKIVKAFYSVKYLLITLVPLFFSFDHF